jgi:hypothetical protein
MLSKIRQRTGTVTIPEVDNLMRTRVLTQTLCSELKRSKTRTKTVDQPQQDGTKGRGGRGVKKVLWGGYVQEIVPQSSIRLLVYQDLWIRLGGQYRVHGFPKSDRPLSRNVLSKSRARKAQTWEPPG